MSGQPLTYMKIVAKRVILTSFLSLISFKTI